MAHQPPPGGVSYSNFPYQQPTMAPLNGNQQQTLPNHQFMVNGQQVPQSKPIQQFPNPNSQQQQPPVPTQQINYQNFQTKAVTGLNGSSTLSSRTSSPGVAPVQAVPQSQLPPTSMARSYPANYQQFQQQPQGSSQLPTTAPMGNNNNTTSPQMPMANPQQNLNTRLGNLTLNPGSMQQQPSVQQHNPMPPMPSSKSDQNFLNNNHNNNGISGMPQMNPSMPPKMNSTSNLSNMPLRPSYPSASGVQSPPMMSPQSPVQSQIPTSYMPQQPQQQQYANQQQQPQRPLQYQNFNQQMLSQQPTSYQNNVVHQGFNKLWGRDSVDLLQNRHILPTTKVLPPPIKLNNMFHESTNCSPDIFRCTLTKIPESNALLQKSRLPLGILIHPYRDLSVSQWNFFLR